MLNNKFKRRLLTTSLSLNAVFVLFFVSKRIYYVNYIFFHPSPTVDERWNVFLNSKNDGKEVVFLGTSITQGFNVSKEFNTPLIKNMGFSGNTTSTILSNLKRVISRKPYKIFIEGGINDFKYKIPLDTAVYNIVEMIKSVQLKSPKTVLYIQSEFPTNLKKLNDTINFYNIKIQSICKEKGVNFINMHNDFLRHGSIDSSLTLDGTHLNETGYFFWRKNIEQFVQ
ncbi:GDSL-type esterase/lipase family protein [Mucilaginibacter kameinonensis]|uniref:GDSL-type esterase/lipase family protein n=1 Tax=Mucilaginibacter kameinonensis TaxID=452286 RepID=UPI000EF77A5B|nr:GDSL-type esterase/lipase family protein [Mucilaginibacter kameinonensis]